MPYLTPTPHADAVQKHLAQQGCALHTYTPEELVHKEISVNAQGLLVHAQTHIPFSTPVESLYMYVMSCDGKIFADQALTGKIYHISLDPSHKSTLAAGQLKCHKGVLYTLDEDSGHFKPCGRVFYVLQRLLELGWKQPFQPAVMASSQFYR